VRAFNTLINLELGCFSSAIKLPGAVLNNDIILAQISFRSNKLAISATPLALKILPSTTDATILIGMFLFTRFVKTLAVTIGSSA
jgi:hypothetical protein